MRVEIGAGDTSGRGRWVAAASIVEAHSSAGGAHEAFFFVVVVGRFKDVSIGGGGGGRGVLIVDDDVLVRAVGGAAAESLHDAKVQRHPHRSLKVVGRPRGRGNTSGAERRFTYPQIHSAPASNGCCWRIVIPPPICLQPTVCSRCIDMRT